MTVGPTTRHEREIKTERLILRAINPYEDAEDVHEWYTYADALKFTTRSPRASLAETTTLLHQRNTSPIMYALTIPRPPSVSPPSTSPPSRRKVIGLLGCKHFPEIGYSLNPAYQGQGYMTEALLAFLPVLFEAMPTAEQGGWDRALALVDEEHVASQRLLERTGWERGGRLEGEYFSPVLGERRNAVEFWYSRPEVKGQREEGGG
ncbi:acyl-CoA N-acyltransferase [Elsinoe ampelina]|uniref:Acyl-CoA N-acyltransferase n=1 Tax=Elsinoe ampelina TaxID=302913 RepID=A0A6A6FYV9_9PEZI|nr:acyl-CoA N-acyltransferase [Elsinoe ampelina]